MKEGAGEDPFADAEQSGGDPATESGSSDADAPETDAPAGASGGTDAESGREQPRIPYKFRRDGVQDGRDRVPLFVRPDTKRAEREALHELEGRFGDDVSLTDLREALVLVGLQHIDEVEARMEEWGYGMTFED